MYNSDEQPTSTVMMQSIGPYPIVSRIERFDPNYIRYDPVMFSINIAYGDPNPVDTHGPVELTVSYNFDTTIGYDLVRRSLRDVIPVGDSITGVRVDNRRVEAVEMNPYIKTFLLNVDLGDIYINGELDPTMKHLSNVDYITREYIEDIVELLRMQYPEDWLVIVDDYFGDWWDISNEMPIRGSDVVDVIMSTTHTKIIDADEAEWYSRVRYILSNAMDALMNDIEL